MHAVVQLGAQSTMGSKKVGANTVGGGGRIGILVSPTKKDVRLHDAVIIPRRITPRPANGWKRKTYNGSDR